MPTYTTWNPSDKHADITLSFGNLTATETELSYNWNSVRSILGVSSDKWYWEITCSGTTFPNYFAVGVGDSGVNLLGEIYADVDGYAYNGYNGYKGNNASAVVFGDTFGNGDVISIALDMDAGKIWWAKNGAWQDSGNPGAGTGEAYSSISGTFYAMAGIYRGDAQTANFGASSFSYSVPSGFNSGFYVDTETIVTLTEPFLVTTELQSNIQVEIVPGALEATSSISVGEIFWGHQVELPEPFSANASLQANTQIEIVPPPLIATGALFSNLGIEVSAGILSATGAILATPVYPIILTGAKRIYLFTLTGAANGVADIIIPISSFQSRIKSGDPTYLSVVIPGTEYASAINARLNGDLIVRMGYQDGNEILLTEIVSRVLFENVTINEGPTNKSITLDGHRTEIWTPKEVSLEDASYYNLTKGKLRYRCKPDLYLRPGDTANINDDSFTVESITYSVSPELETYEIAE